MKASEFTTEDNFGTHPKRPARTGSRHPRGHEPVPRYKTITAQDSDNTAESVAEGPTKDPNAPKLVQDRKTGKWYDPNKEFEKKMTSPKVMAQMKRMAQKEGVAEASYMSVDDYKNNLQKALPSIIEYYQDELGFIPSKEQLASAVKAAHATMERTGDTEQAGESLEAVLDSFVPSNASNKNSPKIDFKKNLLQVLQQKYPDAEFKIGPDRVESTDGQLSVIADTAQEGRYVGCFMWDVSTGPYKGVLGLAVKQTTDQLLRANPGKKPALFIGGDNQNPEAWSHIAKKLKYKLITDENELEEGNQEEKIGGRYDADDFDDMVARLKKLAGAGPMKTVYDPDRLVYLTPPTTIFKRTSVSFVLTDILHLSQLALHSTCIQQLKRKTPGATFQGISSQG